jgi:excisionase family DNA binding protein
MTKDQYPLILTVTHVAALLSVSKRRAYEIMDYTNFPLVRLGRSKRVGRDAFFEWMEAQSQVK